MQDAPGVNCECTFSEGSDSAPQSQDTEIIVPEEDKLRGKSEPDTTEAQGSEQEIDCCDECGTPLEWELRLDGVTVRGCPNC